VYYLDKQFSTGRYTQFIRTSCPPVAGSTPTISVANVSVVIISPFLLRPLFCISLVYSENEITSQVRIDLLGGSKPSVAGISGITYSIIISILLILPSTEIDFARHMV